MDEFAPSILEMQDLCQRNADDLAFLDYCRQRTKVVEAALADLIAALDRAEGSRGCFSCAEQHDVRCLETPDCVCSCGRVGLESAVDRARATIVDRLPDMSNVSTHCAACGGDFIYQVDERTAVNKTDGDWVHVACLATAVECKGCEWQDLCPGCDTELSMTSGGKKQCRRCGFLLTCCDTV